MAFVPIDNCAQVTMLYQTAGDFAENIYYVGSPEAAWTSASLLTLCGVFRSWESASGKTARSTTVGLTMVKARDMTVEGGPEASLVVSPAIFGTDSTGALPDNVSIAIKWVTGVAGRSHRGRTYHIGSTKGFQDTIADNFTAAQAAALLTVYGTLLTDVNATAGQVMVQVSRQENKTPISPANQHPIIGAQLADLHFDSQRRRLLGHNKHH